MTDATPEFPVTSELNEQFKIMTKAMIFLGGIGVCFFSWGAYQTMFGRERESIGITLTLAVFAVGGMAAVVYSIRALRAVPHRSIAFDSDGLWLAALGKEKALIRYQDIYGTSEHPSGGYLKLSGKDGNLLLKVEYNRTYYRELRALILERMASSHSPFP